MEFLKKIGSWADELTKIGISIIALGVVLFWVSYIDALVKAKHLKDAKQAIKKAKKK